MSFDRCPDELLLAILIHLPAVDLAGGIQSANRRFNRLANDPKIWHHHCSTEFRYWNDTERALLKNAAVKRSYDQSWKQIWLRRKYSNSVCAQHFQHVLASKVHRNYHLSAICSLQLDAKDFLVRQYRVADMQSFCELAAGACGKPPPAIAATYCLARRYYANKALGSINRSLAIEEWIRVRNQHKAYVRLDGALAAFDMFVAGDSNRDIETIGRMFDTLAEAFLKKQASHFASMTVREKANRLAVWLRSHNLVGMPNPNERYRDLRNCLIGQALVDHPEHPSLPLISSAIFACVGQRIGLSSHCVTVPGHVHATVLGPRGMSVDGKRLAEDARQPALQLPDNNDRLFYDPYRDSNAMPLQQVRRSVDQLAWTMANPIQMGALHVPVQVVSWVPAPVAQPENTPAGEADADTAAAATAASASASGLVVSTVTQLDAYLLPAPTSVIVLRLALNIDTSWAYATQLGLESSRRVKKLIRKPIPIVSPYPDHDELRRRCGSDGDPHADMESMTYASAWASMLMRPTNTLEWETHMDRVLSRFAHDFNEDAWIIGKYLLPIHDKHVQDAIASDPQGLHARGQDIPIPLPDAAGRQRANAWIHVRNLLGLVGNLDQRQPLVSRRYTQDICERVLYKVGQVIRHRRFDFIGIIDGWTPDDPNDLPGTATMANDEAAAAPENAASHPANARKSPYYSVMRTGVERRVVAQHNIELVTDPRLIPSELMFLAGKHFKRFDYATCTFESNLTEFFPDD